MSEEIRMRPYEMPENFCSNCNADLDKQKGYSSDLSYWVCKSCGMMLINPESDDFESDIVWICDKCEACLNEQPGFSEKVSLWRCRKCGYENHIDTEAVYASAELRNMDMASPTYGMSDADVLALYAYQDIACLDEARKVYFVKDPETGEVFIKKVLTRCDRDLIMGLWHNPVPGMPRIVACFEGLKSITVIEEYISGRTLQKVLQDEKLSDAEIRRILLSLCDIVGNLHGRSPAIIHRDIKPANIMIKGDGTVILLDIDAAKEYKQEDIQDTVLMGTREYAAPEQYGFGASTVRTDIYALGVLMNVMLTGKYPKECPAAGAPGEVVQKCTRLEPNERYESVAALKEAIMRIEVWEK